MKRTTFTIHSGIKNAADVTKHCLTIKSSSVSPALTNNNAIVSPKKIDTTNAIIEYTDPINKLFFIPSLIRLNFFAPTFCPAYVAIVDPKASKGQHKNIEILLEAVTAATTRDPSPFTAVCKITLPIAVMEYCNPIGMPI